MLLFPSLLFCYVVTYYTILVSEWFQLWNQVFKISMWMANFGSPTAKRTILVSTSKSIQVLGQGKLYRDPKGQAFKTAEKYVDRSGAVRYKGTNMLKSTQILEWVLVEVF